MDVDEIIGLSADTKGFPGGASAEEPTSECRRHRRHTFTSWVRKIP